MLHRKCFVFCLLAFILLFAGSTLAGPISDKLTAAELAKVKAGEIISKNEIDNASQKGYGVAYGAIKGSPEDLWKLIMDTGSYMEFYPRLNAVNCLKKTNSQALIEFHMDATATEMIYTTINTIAADRLRMDWTLDKSSPHKYLKLSDGYWMAEPIDGGLMLVEYKVIVELDLGILTKVAEKIVNTMAKDDLPEVVLATKKRIESGFTWKK